MKVSVIIPVYNVAPWIERCLESVLEQSHPELECIVVDDGATDGSGEIVERLRTEHPRGGSLFVIHQIRNQGPSVARNTGTEVATGEYIFYLDGDDELEPGALEAMVAAAEEADFPDWVQGNYLRVPETGKTAVTSYYYPDQPQYLNRDSIVRNFDRLNFTNATNKLIRLSFIARNGLRFRERLIYEDTMWCMQVYQYVQRIATVPRTTYRHNLRSGSIMRSFVTVRKMDSVLYIVRKLGKMEPDENIGHIATLTAVSGLKNLYLGKFSRRYRRRWFRRLWESGVTRMPVDRAALPPLSRMISYALPMPSRMARAYVWGLMGAYRLFKHP